MSPVGSGEADCGASGGAQGGREDGLPVIGIAAGLVAMLLFGILYVLTGSLPALVAGSGGGALLFAIAVAGARKV